MQGDHDIMSPLKFHNASLYALQGTFGNSNLFPKLKWTIQKTAFVSRQVEDSLEIFHLFIGNDHQVPGSMVKKIVGLQSSFVNQG